MPRKPVVTTNNGLFLVLAVNVQEQQNSRFNVCLHRPAVVLRPGRPEVRILPVALKKRIAMYFCNALFVLVLFGFRIILVASSDNPHCLYSLRRCRVKVSGCGTWPSGSVKIRCSLFGMPLCSTCCCRSAIRSSHIPMGIVTILSRWLLVSLSTIFPDGLNQSRVTTNNLLNQYLLVILLL